LQVKNPRTGEYDYTIKPLAAKDIEEKAADLKLAQIHWQQAEIEYRIACLQAWKAQVILHKERLIEALAKDTGRIWETKLEVDMVATSIDRWCKIAEEFFKKTDPKQSSIPFISLQQGLKAYGLIGVISPWNFPLLLSLIDTIPALLAGCAVIVKPSEVTPRFIEVINLTLAPLQNTLTFVAGDGIIGEALIDNCDMICFTGSTATGRKVYDRAAKRMIPVFLELGGKDAAIVCENADLDLASSSILWGSTANAGQSCLSIERVFVHQNVFDEFVEKLVEKAKKIALNSDSINEGKIGPIIFEKQVDIINYQLKDALMHGASIAYGNVECQIINGGYYCLPTIVTNVTNSMMLMQEETFGPIIPIMPFKNNEEALQLANSTIYGLSGAVFAATQNEAIHLGTQMVCGAVSINDCALTAIMHEGEKASFKLSGIGGTRMGPNAIKRFMRQQVMIIKNNAENDPWWYN
jgi:succinate-semialdehyde dehydrogenase / glutarate-semialdehyde dehydrogenase